MSFSLVVMAAGMGSRYGGMKQVEPVGPSGETLLDYSVFDARRAGIDRLVFVIREEMEAAFRREVGHRYEAHLEVAYAFQRLGDVPAGFVPPADRTKPWGTGHAVLAAESAVRGPFLVLNADDFYGRGSVLRAASFLRDAPAAATPAWALVTFPLADTLSDHGAVARGVCELTADGFLRGITEVVGIERAGAGARTGGETPRTFRGDEPVSVNLWAFTRELFPPLRHGFERFVASKGQDLKAEYFLPHVVSDLIDAQRVRVRALPGQGPWFGLTHSGDKPRVRQALADLVATGAYPSPLWP